MIPFYFVVKKRTGREYCNSLPVSFLPGRLISQAMSVVILARDVQAE